MAIRHPRALRRGDPVAVLSPAGALEDRHQGQFEDALARLRGWGLEPVLMPHARDRLGRLAGADKDRAADLQAAIDDPGLRALFCARGGYGVSRVLGRLDVEGLRRDPRPIVGFSDITALQAWAWSEAGLLSCHGPNLVNPSSAMPGEAVLEQQRRLLFDAAEPATLALPDPSEARVVVEGWAEGRLLGGNLTLVAALIGTPWQLDTSGCLLFLEDSGEVPYRVDRLLTQLLSAGQLDRCAGILLGDFHVPGREFGSEDPAMSEVLRERLGDLGVPVLMNLPFGHCPESWSLPFGARASLDTGQSTEPLRIREALGS